MHNKYSIKDLEVLSGIKAHTIRIWEQRYQLLKPQRSDTNIRWYNNDDLRYLLNVTTLHNHGYKISKLCKLSREEICKQVNLIISSDTLHQDQIQGLIMAMVDLDEMKFNKIFKNNIIKNGFEKTMEELIIPFLQKIGSMWSTESIVAAQEHFVSNIIRRRIIVAEDGQFEQNKVKSKKYLMFLPENEMHEISLLYSSYIIKARGHRVVYLGQSVPFNDLEKIAEAVLPDCVLTVVTQAFKYSKIDDFIMRLSQLFKNSQIYISGSQVINSKTKHLSNVKIIKTLSEFRVLADN